jgi:hypothetical protein
MKRYNITESTTELNFEIVSRRLTFAEILTELNFDNTSIKPRFDETTVELNYELRDYDAFAPIYAVLIDFLEAQSIGDIF